MDGDGSRAGGGPSGSLFARAVAILASSLDFETTLDNVIGLCLPELADFGFFDVVAVDGDVRRVARAHEDPHRQTMLAGSRWQRSERTDVNLCALSSGQPAVHPAIDDAWLRDVAVNEVHLAVMRELDFGSMLTVPVRFQGELLGALTLFYRTGHRRHGPEQVRVAEELTSLAAPAVANARLFERHRRAEEALRQNEERLRLALAAGGCGIWDWDVVNDRITWSDRIYDFHGVPRGSFGGTRDELIALIHPDDRERVGAAIARALESGAEYELELRALRPSGEVRWLATRGEVVRDAGGRPLRMLGATIDATDRVRLLEAERAARADAEAAHGRLALLAAAGEAFAASLDPDDAIATIGAVTVPEVADGCRVDLAGPDGAFVHARSFGSIAADVAGAISRVARHRRSQLVEASPSLVALPLTARGRMLGSLVLVRAASGRRFVPGDVRPLEDLARRAALALDNTRLFRQAEAARQAAEAASRAKDEFLAMLGHELRNPLAPIRTAVELLRMKDDARHLEERRAIERHVGHLVRLVDDLLDVSRIARGRIELSRGAVDLSAVLTRALEMASPVIEERAIVVSVEIGADGLWVEGDEVRLTQVFVNLLSNAAKYSEPHGAVRLVGERAGDEVVVHVIDRGVGIDPSLLPRVFDLFVQGRQTLERSQGGLGLGLTIVKNLVELHGGRVAASSPARGLGTEVTVRLPRLATPAALAPAAAQPTAARHGARVLVVDDNVDAADLLAATLDLHGYDTRAAYDGPGALELLDGFVPDVAVVDIGLPVMDGYQLARELRQRVGGALRLVALTGYGLDSDRARSAAAGFDVHLVKPVRTEELVAAFAPGETPPSAAAR